MAEKNTSIGIGEALKNKREEKGISIATAAMQTNLTSNVIGKLEENLFSEIGAPVFVRGYLISYAKFLGMDLDEITEAFNAIDVKETKVKISNANVASHTRTIKKNRWGGWLTILIIIAVIVVLAFQITKKDSWLLTQVNEAFSGHRDDIKINKSNGLDANNLKIEIASNSNENENVAVASNEGMPLSLESSTSDDSDEQETISRDAYVLNPESRNKSAYTPEKVTTPDESKTEIESDEPKKAIEENKSEEVITEGNAESSIGEENKRIVISSDAENWIQVKNKFGVTLSSKVYDENEVINLDSDGAPYDIKIGRPLSVTLSVNGKEEPVSKYRLRSTNTYRIGL